MRKLPITIATLAALAAPALAADDPIAVRQALMSANGKAAAIAGAVSKGELAYSPAIGASVIATMAAVAQSVGDFFPEGSADAARSKAAPKIWEDMAGFTATLDKFKAGAAAAVEASGKDGPADSQAFQAAVGPLFDSCKNCHETYRLEN